MIVPLESIYDSEHLSWTIKCRFFYYRNRLLINLMMSILFIGCIISSIVISRSSGENPETPCLVYSPEDLASSISIQCFRYIWRNCHQSIPNDYKGWWLRSPKGLQMIPCISSLPEEKCGAGSFRTIATYSYLCKLDYKGV